MGTGDCTWISASALALAVDTLCAKGVGCGEGYACNLSSESFVVSAVVAAFMGNYA